MVLVEEVPSGGGGGGDTTTSGAASSSSSSSTNQESAGSSSSTTNQRAGESSNRATGGSTSSSSSSSSSARAAINYIVQDKISAMLFLTRFFSLVCTFLFILPLFGYDPNTLYQKILMSSAATSALKLHQRMSGVPFQLNRVYFGNLILEDSFHYLLYSIIFLNAYPITIVLMPVAAFALLHVSSYLKTLLTLSGQQNGMIMKGVNYVISKDRDIMRFVAVNEIILMPTIIFMVFSAKCGIFMPFIYYRFISMRYQSRRNPYNKTMFYELRVAVEQITIHPSCPQIFRNLSQKAIGLISRFAPPAN